MFAGITVWHSQAVCAPCLGEDHPAAPSFTQLLVVLCVRFSSQVLFLSSLIRSTDKLCKDRCLCVPLELLISLVSFTAITGSSFEAQGLFLTILFVFFIIPTHFL